MNTMPVNITLSAREMRSLASVFDVFRNTMNVMEVDVPLEIKEDMASILDKMVDRLMDQMINKAMEN